jgi:hypothetical protein
MSRSYPLSAHWCLHGGSGTDLLFIYFFLNHIRIKANLQNVQTESSKLTIFGPHFRCSPHTSVRKKTPYGPLHVFLFVYRSFSRS